MLYSFIFYAIIPMKQQEFLKIKENAPYSRIGRRSREGQEIRDELALVLKKQRKRKMKWKGIWRWLMERKEKLEVKKYDMEIEDISRVIDTNQLKESDLKFLENLSRTDLCKIKKYNQHRMRQIVHTASDWGVVTSWKYPYYPKYTFLYEIFRDNSLISDALKLELKEKAKEQVWKMVCDEISNDTILYDKWPWFVKHVCEYIPQKVFANKIRWTGNRWTRTNVDVLWYHIDWFTELDEEYKKEIRREYYKEHGKVDPEVTEKIKQEEIEAEEGDGVEDFLEEETWDELLDAYMRSKRKDVKAFQAYMREKEKERRRFDDWLEKEWWL